MLTGWFDRVLRRGLAWELPDGASRIEARLTNIRRLVAITTHGSPKLLNVLEGESGRRVISRAVRVLCNRFARTTWLAMYDIDHASQADRQAFLDRVNAAARAVAGAYLGRRRSNVVTTSTWCVCGNRSRTVELTWS